jgi:tRNA G18 (ribose-2'-O)-methylase SpoU
MKPRGTVISSDQNPLVVAVRRWQTDARHRREADWVWIENPKVIAELAQSASRTVDTLWVTEGTRLPSWAQPLRCVEVSARLMQSLLGIRSESAMAAMVRKPVWPDDLLRKANTVLVLDGLQHPQNVGAVVRNAHAFGVDAVVALSGCADTAHPEALRASSGSYFHVPMWSGDAVLDLLDLKPPWVATSTQASDNLTDFSWPERCVIVMGSEGRGIQNPAVLRRITHTLRIPTDPTIDSLNVAVSSGIVLYERFIKTRG